MTAQRLDNLSQSVKQRLLNLSREQGEPFNPLLIRYGVERLLYRLTQTPHAKDFVLKGATLFAVWTGKPHRPTQDVDLLGFGAPDIDRLVGVFRDVCRADVIPDGLAFDTESVAAAAIREGNIYDGVRVRLVAMLGKARISLQVDVGFGDAVTPDPDKRTIGPMLDFPAPVLRAYRPETVVAEKLHAIVELGMGNSRMKDYFDLWTISETMSFDFPMLHEAIMATFERRKTALPDTPPIGLTDRFATDDSKQKQWAGFIRKMNLSTEAPPLDDIVVRLRVFLLPLFVNETTDSSRSQSWKPGGPWTLSA